MPLNREQIISMVSQLAQHENLEVTVVESTKGACIVGASAFAGSIFGGPVGLAAGGIIGSLIAYARGRGRYKSLVDVIAYDMTSAQRHRLADSVRKVIQDLRIEDCTLLLPIVLNNVVTKELVIKEVARFLQNEMNLAITSS